MGIWQFRRCWFLLIHRYRSGGKVIWSDFSGYSLFLVVTETALKGGKILLGHCQGSGQFYSSMNMNTVEA